MKKIIFSIIICVCSIYVFAKSKKNVNICDGSDQNPCLVIENTDPNSMPKSWRTSKMLKEHYFGNTDGLSQIWMSGSAAPTPKQFKYIKKEIQNLTHKKSKNIVDIDLREETHGYLNGIPITLRSLSNAANLGKTKAQILLEEQMLVKDFIKTSNNIKVLLKSDFKNQNFTIFQILQPHSALTEAELSERSGFRYERFIVTDHSPPRLDQVKNFVELVDNLPQNTWVHFHCAAGKGRTTTFMAMYDMLKNAHKVSFEDIIKRQASYTPYYDLSYLERNEPERMFLTQKRYKFLKEFYQFSRARNIKLIHEKISI